MNELPRIVCLDCMRDVLVTYIDWNNESRELSEGISAIFRVECHEIRIARLGFEARHAIEHAKRPILWSELKFYEFKDEDVQRWEAEAMQLMERVRIVTEHFKAGGK